MFWDDRVFRDPDGVDISAIFEDIHGEDARQQYEAVAGLKFLADLRPGRVEPFESDLFGLLGAMPGFGLGDPAESSGSTTRDWAAEAVASYARAHPRIIPELFNLAQSPDRRTREDSRRALCPDAGWLDPDTGASSDGNHPPLAVAEHIHDHRSIITDWLHDECQSTTSTALRLLAGIAPWYCETATEALPVAASHLEDNDLYRSAVALVGAVALCNDQRRAALVDQLIGALPDPDSGQERRLVFVLGTLVDIAEEHPDCRSQIDDFPEELTDYEHDAVRLWMATLSYRWGHP